MNLLIPIDLLDLEFKPEVRSNVLFMSSVSKSMGILLFWSPELYVHHSVLHHGYIYHSSYLVILSTFFAASG